MYFFTKVYIFKRRTAVHSFTIATKIAPSATLDHTHTASIPHSSNRNRVLSAVHHFLQKCSVLSAITILGDAKQSSTGILSWESWVSSMTLSTIAKSAIIFIAASCLESMDRLAVVMASASLNVLSCSFQAFSRTIITLATVTFMMMETSSKMNPLPDACEDINFDAGERAKVCVSFENNQLDITKFREFIARSPGEMWSVIFCGGDIHRCNNHLFDQRDLS